MGQNETKPTKPVQSASDKMFDQIFEFKMMSKNFSKEAVKAANQEKALTLKVKDAIEKNMLEAARIHASDAIRKKNESRRYQILSSKLDAVHSRLQNAYQTQKLTENMQELTGRMFNALGTMDLVKVNETMSNFEKMFDNLDVNNELMNQVFDNVNAGATNEKEVDNLIEQVAVGFGMQLEGDFADIKAHGGKKATTEKVGPSAISNSNMNI